MLSTKAGLSASNSSTAYRGVGIMQYVYALNPVCIVLIIPGHSAEKFPVRAVDIVNPGLCVFIAPDIH